MEIKHGDLIITVYMYKFEFISFYDDKKRSITIMIVIIFC